MPTDETLLDLETVGVTRRGGAATIELRRPETVNAWNRQLGVDLLAAVRHVSDAPEVRAVAIRGSGRGFSSGADLRAGFDPTPEGHPDVLTTLRERYHPIITGIRRLPKPVVAVVHGAAAGIGCSLALACDLVVAAESSFFLLAFVNIGLMPDGGSTLLVPARVGQARAFEMALLGERIPAPQALDWGLVNRVWPDAELEERAAELLGRLAAGPADAYAGVKAALNAWLFRGMDEQLELEAETQQRLAATPDFAEGVRAFAERRPARFGET